VNRPRFGMSASVDLPTSSVLDEVAARQFVADRACYALRDALVCRVGQGMERGAQPQVIIDGKVRPLMA
jgi:hypothetical protein